MKKKHGIVNEREEMFEYLTEWVDAIGDRQFLHGDKITMPDLLVFGVLRSISGLRTFEDIMSQEKNAKLLAWYTRCAEQVKPHAE